MEIGLSKTIQLCSMMIRDIISSQVIGENYEIHKFSSLSGPMANSESWVEKLSWENRWSSKKAVNSFSDVAGRLATSNSPESNVWPNEGLEANEMPRASSGNTFAGRFPAGSKFICISPHSSLLESPVSGSIERSELPTSDSAGSEGPSSSSGFGDNGDVASGTQHLISEGAPGHMCLAASVSLS